MNDYLIQDIRNMNKYTSKMMRSGLSKMPPLIITCAVTGGNHGKESNPNLPETIDEQVAQTVDAYNAGASMVHIHARGKQEPAYMTQDVNDYREVNAKIREKCPDIIINNTVGGGSVHMTGGMAVPPTRTALEACPEVASIDITNFCARTLLKKRPAPLTGRDEDIIREMGYTLSPTEATETINIMNKNGIKPEFECFDIGDLLYVDQLRAEGIVQEPYWIQFVMNPATNYASIDYIQMMMKHAPENSILSLIAVGPCSVPMLTAAIILGLHVRVGMEDNIYFGKGQLVESNAQLVKQIADIARALGRPIATPQQAREMLGLGEPRKFEF